MDCGYTALCNVCGQSPAAEFFPFLAKVRNDTACGVSVAFGIVRKRINRLIFRIFEVGQRRCKICIAEKIVKAAALPAFIGVFLCGGDVLVQKFAAVISDGDKFPRIAAEVNGFILIFEGILYVGFMLGRKNARAHCV